MKITQITIYKPIKNNFKQNNFNKEYQDNYEIENNITMKDAIISAGIVTSLCTICTTILANEDTIKNYLIKCKKIVQNIITNKKKN